MTNNSRPSFEQIAMRLAETVAERSEDPYVKVGCCILRHDNSVASLGYNGAPPGVNIDWSNRDERRQKVIHAEINALRYVKPGECKLMAITLSPCAPCLTSIAAYGIKKVLFARKYPSYKDVSAIAKEYGIELVWVPAEDACGEVMPLFPANIEPLKGWDFPIRPIKPIMIQPHPFIGQEYRKGAQNYGSWNFDKAIQDHPIMNTGNTKHQGSDAPRSCEDDIAESWKLPPFDFTKVCSLCKTAPCVCPAFVHAPVPPLIDARSLVFKSLSQEIAEDLDRLLMQKHTLSPQDETLNDPAMSAAEKMEMIVNAECAEDFDRVFLKKVMEKIAAEEANDRSHD